jgi:uncharacterized membrane protein
MYSKVTIAGHPLHPMLVGFPVTLYVAALACYATYGVNEDPFWFRAGWYANAAGVVMAVVAAIPGFVDWATGVPRGTTAKRTGLFHMLFNVLALLLFAVAAVVLRPQLDEAIPDLGPGLVLALLGVASTIAAGYLGWRMVQTHHVGVLLTPEQERIDPNVIEAGRGQPPSEAPTYRPSPRHT